MPLMLDHTAFVLAWHACGPQPSSRPTRQFRWKRTWSHVERVIPWLAETWKNRWSLVSLRLCTPWHAEDKVRTSALEGLAAGASG